jgi:hypothetical protein
LLFISYLFFSSKVTYTRSIIKYTQQVMLTHYSTLEGSHLSRLVTRRIFLGNKELCNKSQELCNKSQDLDR